MREKSINFSPRPIRQQLHCLVDGGHCKGVQPLKRLDGIQCGTKILSLPVEHLYIERAEFGISAKDQFGRTKRQECGGTLGVRRNNPYEPARSTLEQPCKMISMVSNSAGRFNDEGNGLAVLNFVSRCKKPLIGWIL